VVDRGEQQRITGLEDAAPEDNRHPGRRQPESAHRGRRHQADLRRLALNE
jgi:hypothetical protein